MWNGDVFKYNNKSLSPGTSDTEFIFSKLRDSVTDQDVINIFQSIQGPWACVFWDKTRNILWFGRDFFGRQSLLIHRSKLGLILSSVAPQDETYKFTEVRADGIYKLNLTYPSDKPVIFPWDCLPQYGLNPELTGFSISSPVRLVSDNPEKIIVDTCIDTDLIMESLLRNPAVDNLVIELINKLSDAVRTRIELQPGKCKDCLQVIFFSYSILILFRFITNPARLVLYSLFILFILFIFIIHSIHLLLIHYSSCSSSSFSLFILFILFISVVHPVYLVHIHYSSCSSSILIIHPPHPVHLHYSSCSSCSYLLFILFIVLILFIFIIHPAHLVHNYYSS